MQLQKKYEYNEHASFCICMYCINMEENVNNRSIALVLFFVLGAASHFFAIACIEAIARIDI